MKASSFGFRVQSVVGCDKKVFTGPEVNCAAAAVSLAEARAAATDSGGLGFFKTAHNMHPL